MIETLPVLGEYRIVAAEPLTVEVVCNECGTKMNWQEPNDFPECQCGVWEIWLRVMCIDKRLAV